MVKITDTTRTQQTGKNTKTKSKAPTGGPSFADLVHAAQNSKQANANQPINPDAGGGAYAPILPPEDDIPSAPQERAAYLLEHLKQLEADILSGTPTAAIAKLQQALAAGDMDKSQLSPQLQQLLDEIDTRAQIEVAKLTR